MMVSVRYYLKLFLILRIILNKTVFFGTFTNIETKNDNSQKSNLVLLSVKLAIVKFILLFHISCINHLSMHIVLNFDFCSVIKMKLQLCHPI